MIPVQVVNVSISNVGFMVLLRSAQDERSLPIFIGVSEAQAIAMELNDTKPPRPMTHDLLKNILLDLQCNLDHIVVHSLSEGTFYARLAITSENGTLDLDARPSDAIALALRFQAPVYVEEEVMEEAGVVVEESQEQTEAEAETDEAEQEQEQEKSQEGVEDPVERLKADLSQAIKEERYEDAAQLRDQIRQQMSHN